MTVNTNHSSTPNLRIAHCIARNPIKSFFQIHKANVKLLSFNSEILLHLSYSKNDISGSFTFHKFKLHIIYLNLLRN